MNRNPVATSAPRHTATPASAHPAPGRRCRTAAPPGHAERAGERHREHGVRLPVVPGGHRDGTAPTPNGRAPPVRAAPHAGPRTGPRARRREQPPDRARQRRHGPQPREVEVVVVAHDGPPDSRPRRGPRRPGTGAPRAPPPSAAGRTAQSTPVVEADEDEPAQEHEGRPRRPERPGRERPEVARAHALDVVPDARRPSERRHPDRDARAAPGARERVGDREDGVDGAGHLARPVRAGRARPARRARRPSRPRARRPPRRPRRARRRRPDLDADAEPDDGRRVGRGVERPPLPAGGVPVRAPPTARRRRPGSGPSARRSPVPTRGGTHDHDGEEERAGEQGEAAQSRAILRPTPTPR